MRSSFRVGAVMLACLWLAGCATPGPVLTESVGKVRAGTALAGEQSNLSLVAANAQARERGVEYKIGDPSLTLREADFPLAVSREDVLAWQAAFSALDQYMAALQKLVDPARAGETSDNLNAVGTALSSGSLGVKLPQGTAEAFATLGGAIVQARAEHKATEVMRRVDPAFTALMGAMADAIGADDHANLRGTVRANWESAIGHVRSDYAALPPAPLDARRDAATRFVTMLDTRDATDANLAALRTSLLALGEAHAAAAKGNSGDALFWVGRISAWLDDVQKRIDAAKKAEGDKK